MHSSIALLTSFGSLVAVVTAQGAPSCSPILGTIPQPPGQPQITACANALKLGDKCGDSRQCPSGVQCYASTEGLVRICGNFNAECTTDDQCAYNACNAGICNGFRATTTSAAPTMSSTCTPIIGTIQLPQGQPQVTACPNSLKLGEPCSDDRQCPSDVSCFGSTAGTIRSCGNFNAECSSDSQCAYNTCNNGLCNGFKKTASSSAATASSTVASTNSPGYPAGNTSAPVPSTGNLSTPTASAPAGSSSTSAPPTNLAATLVPGGLVAVLGTVLALL